MATLNSPYGIVTSPYYESESPSLESAWASSPDPMRTLAPSGSSKVGHFLNDLSARMQKTSLGRKTSTSNSEPNAPHRTLSGRSRMPVVSRSETGRDAPSNFAWAYPPAARSRAEAAALYNLAPAYTGPSYAPSVAPAPPRPMLAHAKSSNDVGAQTLGRCAPRDFQLQAPPLQRPKTASAKASVPLMPPSLSSSSAGGDVQLQLSEQQRSSEFKASTVPPSPRHPARNIVLPTSIKEAFLRYDELCGRKVEQQLQLHRCERELDKIGRQVMRHRTEQERLERRRAQWARNQRPAMPTSAQSEQALERPMADVPEGIVEAYTRSTPPLSLPSSSNEFGAQSLPMMRPQQRGGGFGPLVIRTAIERSAQSAPVTPQSVGGEVLPARDFPWEQQFAGSASTSSQEVFTQASGSLEGSLHLPASTWEERNVDQMMRNEMHQLARLLGCKAEIEEELRELSNELGVLFRWGCSFERR